jgi:hypothetical protein
VPRELKDDDILYREPLPEHVADDGTPKREGFIDHYESLSFFVKGTWPDQVVTPRFLLTILAKRPHIQANYSGRAPSPEQLYLDGYRVAQLAGREILLAIAAPDSPVTIELDRRTKKAISRRGHLGLTRGKVFSDIWARRSVVLSKKETLI